MECYHDLIMCSNEFSFALLIRNRRSSLAPFGIAKVRILDSRLGTIDSCLIFF